MSDTNNRLQRQAAIVFLVSFAGMAVSTIALFLFPCWILLQFLCFFGSLLLVALVVHQVTWLKQQMK